MKFHQLVQEISWVQEFVTPTPTSTPTPTGSALKPICPPYLWLGGGGQNDRAAFSESVKIIGGELGLHCLSQVLFRVQVI